MFEIFAWLSVQRRIGRDNSCYGDDLVKGAFWASESTKYSRKLHAPPGTSGMQNKGTMQTLRLRILSQG
jgi:hypothetical protein